MLFRSVTTAQNICEIQLKLYRPDHGEDDDYFMDFLASTGAGSTFRSADCHSYDESVRYLSCDVGTALFGFPLIVTGDSLNYVDNSTDTFTWSFNGVDYASGPINETTVTCPAKYDGILGGQPPLHEMEVHCSFPC